jgi:RimJ/RimL family protein N-acetyltransferase
MRLIEIVESISGNRTVAFDRLIVTELDKMPLLRPQDVTAPRTTVTAPAATSVVTTDWRDALPVLSATSITLREMRTSDAPSLFALLTTEEVARFISPPPGTVEGFERFIVWAARQRAAGAYVCFAVTLAESDTAIGIFQLRSTEPGFATAEWGFALGSPFWGTGIFEKGAKLVMEFAFETVGVHRLEVHEPRLEDSPRLVNQAYSHLARMNIRSYDRALELRRMIIAKMQNPPDEAVYAEHLRSFETRGAEIHAEAEAARKLINSIIADTSTDSDNLTLARLDNRIANANDDLRRSATEPSHLLVDGQSGRAGGARRCRRDRCSPLR